ncbi:hypothetical protein QBC37DRAFT_435847 [Rhypophila decipiens]|uniref:Myb-like domain-containing protein n=1 Tax=Rhypophila decipiens TaxID=261697 RepID=A0AAN6XSP8_9PEZI|nr:hypothetical protein QBC37DRAFT_435847 [Rhypophila decipiens]
MESVMFYKPKQHPLPARPPLPTRPPLPARTPPPAYPLNLTQSPSPYYSTPSHLPTRPCPPNPVHNQVIPTASMNQGTPTTSPPCSGRKAEDDAKANLRKPEKFTECESPSYLPLESDVLARDKESSTSAARLVTPDVNSAANYDSRQALSSIDKAPPEAQECHEIQNPTNLPVHPDCSPHTSSTLATQRSNSSGSLISASNTLKPQNQEASSGRNDVLGTSDKSANSAERVQGNQNHISCHDISGSLVQAGQKRQSQSDEEDAINGEQDKTRRPNKRQKLIPVEDLSLADSAHFPTSPSHASSVSVTVGEHETRSKLSDSYTPASSLSPSLPDRRPAAEYREYPISGTFKCMTIGDDVHCNLEFTTSRPSCGPDVSQLLKRCFGREVRELPLVTEKAIPNTRNSPLRARYTPEEDQKLVRLREEEGFSWSEIAEEFPARSESGLKLRYSTVLRPSASQQRTSTRTRRRKKAHQKRDESPGPQTSTDNNDEYEVDKILGHRMLDDGSIEYNVLWVGGDCTSEPHTGMMNTMALDTYLRSCLTMNHGHGLPRG